MPVPQMPLRTASKQVRGGFSLGGPASSFVCVSKPADRSPASLEEEIEALAPVEWFSVRT